MNICDFKGPKLIHHERADCVPLTDGFIDEAVEKIVAWYDAVGRVLIG